MIKKLLLFFNISYFQKSKTTFKTKSGFYYLKFNCLKNY